MTGSFPDISLNLFFFSSHSTPPTYLSDILVQLPCCLAGILTILPFGFSENHLPLQVDQVLATFSMHFDCTEEATHVQCSSMLRLACGLQAMARVWRDGQQHHTYVYRLLAAGSIEEKIFQRQVNKQGLTGAVVDARIGDNQMPAFDAEQLRRLFCLNESTLCETHDLLDCHCITGNAGAKSDPVAHENVRDCQLHMHGAAHLAAVSAVTSICYEYSCTHPPGLCHSLIC